MGTLYIFGAGLQGWREDGRDLISCCRKKEGRWKEAWIHLENHVDVSSPRRIPSGDCGELLSTRKQSQSKRHFSRALLRANYIRSTPWVPCFSSLFLNSVICPSSLLCRNWRLATRQERRWSNIRVLKSLFIGLMENESRSWEIRAAILRGWTAQTFHIDRDLRLWFPNKLIATNAALIITCLQYHINLEQ